MKRIKVLVAKPGLDGHDRGAKVICRALRDAGMEVVYSGLEQNPEQIVSAAIQEDADVIGLSILSGAHRVILPAVTRMLKEKGITDVLVIVGGIIPTEDQDFLKQHGIAAIFGPGTPLKKTVEYIRENVSKERISIEEK
ncbi:MAG: cobalamin B12-binding domain-containing protein [Promethearchaeota archaeon]